MLTDNICDLNLENFQAVVLDGSQDKLVAVEFWADAVEGGMALQEPLARIAADYPDDLIVARVDCQTQQEIAGQFGIQSLPTVVLVKTSQPVGGIAGVQPEQAVRDEFAKHLPSMFDKKQAQAKALFAEANYADALVICQEALALEPENAEAKKMLAEAYIHTGQLSDVESLLETIGIVDQDAYYKSVLAQLELAQQASNSPEIQALEQAYAEQPENDDIALQLAVQLQQVQRVEDALSCLFTVLKRDLNAQDGEVKRIFMDILQASAAGDTVAIQYRRKLYSLLY